jgi:hypothetical protein
MRVPETVPLIDKVWATGMVASPDPLAVQPTKDTNIAARSGSPNIDTDFMSVTSL